MHCWNPCTGVWKGPAEHFSQFSTACVHACVPSVDPFMRFHADFRRIVIKVKGNGEPKGQKASGLFFLCSDYKAHTFFFFFLFAVSCLHAHLRVFPACSFNFRALVKIHKPHTRAQSSTGKKRHYDEGASLLHTKVAHNHYTLQVRVCLYWGFTPTDEQANAMTQQAECTRGTICLHQLQRTNYPDYRAVWVYMSVCLCV